jgi:hypothetical protein
VTRLSPDRGADTPIRRNCGIFVDRGGNNRPKTGPSSASRTSMVKECHEEGPPR